MSAIPRNPQWCSNCIADKAPCDFHKGPDGSFQPYMGTDAYLGSDWVLNVVNSHYRGVDNHGPDYPVRSWICFGYDPRSGFWMRTIDDRGPQREINISERAIGRTWHKEKAHAES